MKLFFPMNKKEYVIEHIAHRGGGIARTDYYLNNTITDVEFKYLVDSVLYSRIFNTEDARNLAKRIQMLSGKNLVELTPYVNNSFGEQRFFLQKKVLENVEKLMDAIRKFQYITFRWNDYDVDNGKIVLRHVDDRVAKPITLLLNDGRYFLFARRYGCKELRTYSIDLMENIETVIKKDDHLGNGEMEKDFQYSRYISQHPFMMGGIPYRYRLRVERVMFARVVDYFALGIRIIPGTQTEQTVDVEVRASRKGMVYWLLSHFDTAHLIDNSDSELAKELADAVEKLKSFYQND